MKNFLSSCEGKREKLWQQERNLIYYRVILEKTDSDDKVSEIMFEKQESIIDKIQQTRKDNYEFSL